MSVQSESKATVVLGRYRIVARLAKGGMGVVFLARAEGAAGFAKPVVVKRILPDMNDDQMTRMFVREARILSNLQHPGIVSIIDFGEEDGAYLMVLDYVRAYHLGRWMRYLRKIEEPFPVDIALHVIIKVLDALEYAHTLKMPDGTPLDIVHADVSPSNILIDNEGQVKLVDFGIARASGEAVTAASDSGSLSIKGKFAYLAPELLSGHVANARSDLYACAVILYEMLVGHSAFQSSDMHQTIRSVLMDTLPGADLERSDVSRELARVIDRALSKEPAERHASAAELARDLRALRKMPEEAAAAALTAMARRDYGGDMPQKMGLTPLNELEATWRNPPAVPISLESVDSIPVLVAAEDKEAARRPARVSDKPTVVAPAVTAQKEPSPEAPPAPTEKRRAWVPVMGLAVAGIGIAGVVAVVATRKQDPQFIVVERGTSTETASASASSPEPPPSAPSLPTGSTTPSIDKPQPARTGQTTAAAAHPDDLSSAFARHQPQIEACFRDNVDALKGTPEISVRFTTDREGHVQHAELVPPELANLPLGQCILGVARSTRFPPQAASFRIPIRAKR